MNKLYKYWIPTFVGMDVDLTTLVGEDLFVLSPGGSVWKVEKGSIRRGEAHI